MDPIDQLLGKLDASAKQPPPPNRDTGSAKVDGSSASSQASTQSASTQSASAQSIDQLLEHLGEKAKQTVQAQLLQGLRSPHPSNSSSHSYLKPASKAQPNQPSALPDFSLHPPIQTPIFPKPDPSLEKFKAVYEEQQHAAEVKRQQELQAVEWQRQQDAQEKQRRLEQLRQQRRAELAKQAKTWLKKLNPRSTEGQWFEEFACNYESREEAAIDYLEALEEAHRIGSGTGNR